MGIKVQSFNKDVLSLALFGASNDLVFQKIWSG